MDGCRWFFVFALLQSACEESAPLYVPVTSSSGSGGAGGAAGGGGSGGGGGFFTGLSGQFDLGDGCTLLLSGSSGTMDCELEGSDFDAIYTDIYDLELQIQETAITAIVRNLYVETSSISPDYDYNFVAVADFSAALG